MTSQPDPSNFAAANRPLLDEHRAAHELQTSEARLRSVLESVVDGIIVIDERGLIESFNAAAERIFGYCSEEVLGRNVSLLMPEHYANAHDGYLRNYLMTGQKKIIGIGREVTGRRQDGSTFPMDLAVNAMRVGEKRCFTGIVRDISARKRHEREMAQALEVAEAASRAKSEFLSSMSHELRTPMNAILGFGQLLELDGALTAEQADNVQEILKAGHHLMALINEVLDLARIESGRLTLSMEPLAMAELINECLALVESGAVSQGLTVSREIAPCHNCWVRADRLRLKQVLINLLSNAVKYNREGGGIQMTCESKSTGQVRLAVTDTGPGIPQDKLGDLFTPFNRLGLETGTIEGSGIGLVISKRLIESMGGEIGVDSRPGQGCTFWVELAETEPLAAPFALATSDASTVAGGMLPTGKPGCHTLLYIEDNPANLRLMQQVLAPRTDIHLLSTGEPLTGLELARGASPDLIMLDINLPGMNGFEVLKQLQAQADTCNIPVLAITANAMPEDIERGLAAGFLAYLTKPLDLVRLQTEIDRLLAYAKTAGKTAPPQDETPRR
jgi:PAS domain S-box-containing protein